MRQSIAAPVARLPDVARGPGRLADALAIDRSLDGLDMCKPGGLWLAQGTADVGEIGSSVRIGITRAIEQPWRLRG